MLLDRDIRQAAKLLVDGHGQGATLHAAQRADELLEDGDLDGRDQEPRRCYGRIEEARRELRRVEQGPGERVS